MSPTTLIGVDLWSFVDVFQVELGDAMLRITEEELTIFEGGLLLLISREITEHRPVSVWIDHFFIAFTARIIILRTIGVVLPGVHVACNRRETLIVASTVEI